MTRTTAAKGMFPIEDGRIGFADRATRASPRAPAGLGHPAGIDLRVERPRLLDLYCGAGGAGMGYSDAGFAVTGIDHSRQPNYPFEFIQADCLSIDPAFVATFDAIHASPPCQKYTRKTPTWGRPRVHWIDHQDLLGATRTLLQESGLPWAMENVEGAPLHNPVMLCGTWFGLRIIKHRFFETSFPLVPPMGRCDHSDVFNPWQGKGRTAAEFRSAQGTPWIPTGGGASRKAGVTGDLYNAIPPAYTRFIGEQLMAHLAMREAA